MTISDASPEPNEDYSLVAVQRRLCSYLRNPAGSVRPRGLDVRRLNVYRDLVFANVESLLSGAYPVAKRVLGERWQSMVRAFLSEYRAQTPYFTRLADEFFQFVGQREDAGDLPPFLRELLHHERLEIELLYRQVEDLHPPVVPFDQAPLALSPLAEVNHYRYPVQRIGPDFMPQRVPESPTFILQYRNAHGRVVFMELSHLAYQLLWLISQHPGHCGEFWMKSIDEMLAGQTARQQREDFLSGGLALLARLFDTGVLQGR